MYTLHRRAGITGVHGTTLDSIGYAATAQPAPVAYWYYRVEVTKFPKIVPYTTSYWYASLPAAGVTGFVRGR